MEPILNKINRSGLKFLEPLTSAETFETIVKEAIELFGAEYGSLYLESEGRLVRVYSTLPIADKLKASKDGFTYQAFLSLEPTVHYAEEVLKIHPIFGTIDVKANIFIPLAYRKKAIGVLVVNSAKKREFDSSGLETMKLFGSLATLAIRKTQLYEETKAALELRDKFISMAAHELRTPLTSVSGYIQLLNGRLAGENSVESRWTEQLLWESQRLTNLVNELLAVNQIRSGKLQYVWKECSLVEIIRRSLDNFHLIYPQYQIRFENHLEQKSDLVIGDFDKLLQVLSNLLNNAVKFSPENKPIIVKLSDKGQDLKLEVVDQGAGIPRQEIPNIFDDYYKGSGNLKQGMGLGLSIVKTIINQHHGTIQVKSKNGSGTTMVVYLPKPKRNARH